MKDIDYHTLAETYKTPLYVYDLQKISSAFLRLKEAFRARKSLICYALKANSSSSRHTRQWSGLRVYRGSKEGVKGWDSKI